MLFRAAAADDDAATVAAGCFSALLIDFD